MSDDQKLSKMEYLKEDSRQLRGTIAEELNNDSPTFSEDACQLLKAHGTYQQDDRDRRKDKNPDGSPAAKSYICMVRTRIPGGRLTADQVLAELDLCDKYGNGTLRVTTRQGFQLHGVIKNNLRETIRAINKIQLTTLAACGDVERNVMCCPAPIRNNPVRDELQQYAARVAEHLKPRTTAYYEIWLRDEDGNETNVADFQPVDEPIYGTRYLPRKFKTAFALPDDNCVDIYSNDLGFVAIVENNRIQGFNVLVGGSMGMTPSVKKTFPAVALKMAYITPDQVIDLAEAVVKVQRDFGNRADRKVARMKYLIADWGLEKFKAKVEEYYGRPLAEPHPTEVTDVDDHGGWHEQGDGRWFLGINIENGRIKDEGDFRLKTALRTILSQYRMPVRTTPFQGMIFCDIDPQDRDDISRIFADHGVKLPHELSLVRRYAMACPALPTCHLAITESERVFPNILDEFEAELARHGLADERISIHMTGCPNGCARPYSPDIGLVGKTLGKYSVYLGGNTQGTRLAFLYRDLIPLENIVSTLAPLFAYFKDERQPGESFGDFCHRKGLDDLNAYIERQTKQDAA